MIDYCRKLIVLLFILFAINGILAQDSLSLKSDNNVVDKLNVVNTKTKDSIVTNNISSNKTLLDSISIQNQKKLDRTVWQESLPNQKEDLSVITVPQDSTKGYADHPRLKDLDEYWRQELFNNSLFDSVYSVVKNTDYTKIEYVPNLPTEVLKQRLSDCLLYTSPSPRDATLSRMPSSA